MEKTSDILDRIRKLSQNQLEALKLQMSQRTYSSNATTSTMKLPTGKSTGGILTSLKRNKLIIPAGKTNGMRTLNWQVTPEIENNREEVTKLIDNILNLYK